MLDPDFICRYAVRRADRPPALGAARVADGRR
jgi:hypothetical protein